MPGSRLVLRACRPVEDDAARVMAWRNDPQTLRMFYHREPKRWDSFWPEFRDTYFRHPTLPPLFAVDDGQPVAFLRFQPLAEKPDWVDVSINVAPGHRGRGLGTRCLTASLPWLTAAGAEGVLAEVRVENEASGRAFLAAGYQAVDICDKHIEDTGETCRIGRFQLRVPPGRAGLFVDLDGTLAASLPVMREVFGAFLAEHGVTATDEAFQALNGPPLDQVVEHLRDRHGLPGDLPSLIRRYHELVDARYATVAANPGAAELLRRASGMGLVVGVVTSNRRALAARWTESRGLARYFSVLVGEEDGDRGKPFADPYLAALRAGGCDGRRSAAVEDSPGGVAAALAAGLKTFHFSPDGRAWPGAGRPTTVRSLAEVADMLAP